MKPRLLLLLSFLIACGVHGESVTFNGVTFIGSVDGIRYETTLKADAVGKTGGFVGYEKVEGKSRHTYLSEPAGISLREAMDKADAVAKRILGKGLEGNDPRWILRSAERVDAGSEAGYYYHFCYSTRAGAYSSPEWLGPAGVSESSCYSMGRSSSPNASNRTSDPRF